jgi:co-chaperonin GroES (HSP10)
MKKLVAVNDHVIVEILQEIEEITDAGIVIPESIVKKPQGYGKIISIGSQVNIALSIGDTIIFHKQGGMDVMIGSKIFKVLKQPEVYARLEDTKEEVS